MKRLCLIILYAGLISALSYKAYADESGPMMSMAQKPITSAQMQSRKEKIKELRIMTEKFNSEQELLREQLKVEKNEDKLNDIRLKLRTLYQERLHALNPLRADLGLPLLKVSVQENRNELFMELRTMIEKFHKEQEVLLKQLKIEKDEVKIRDLRQKIRILYQEFKKNTDIIRAQLGLPVQKVLTKQDRAEKFQELRSLIEQFHKDRETIEAQIKAEKDQGKINDLKLRIRELFRDFRKALDAKRAELGLPDHDQKVK